MPVALTRVLLAGLVLVPTAAAAQYSAPTTPAPGPSFVWIGQWVPCDHPLAIQAGKGCVSATPTTQILTEAPESDEPPPPPAADEWGTTDAYTGVAASVPVLLRTANPDRWFVKGGRYIAPYADFRMTILDRVRLADGSWGWLGQITQSGGAPPKGTILSYPLYGDRGFWLTEEEFASAVAANGGVR
jgi:hypothetical protein